MSYRWCPTVDDTPPLPPVRAGDYKLFMDEGSPVTYASCPNGTLISAITEPIFGNAEAKCNSTDTYT